MPSFAYKRAVLACAVSGIFSLSVFAPAYADDAQDVNKLMKAGQYDQAMQKVDGVLAQKPRDAQMRFLKGLIYTEQGKTNDAIGIFLRLTEDYPELPEPYNNLAVLFASQGQYDKARASLEMAIRTHPSYATAHENLGDIYAKLASQAYDKALQLDANNSAAQTKLSLIRELFSANGKKGSIVTPPLASAAPMTGKPAPAPAPVAAATPAPAPVKPTSAPAAPTPAPTPAPSPAPTPAPAPVKPTPAPAPVAASSAEQSQVSDAIDTWAKAWAAKDMDSYLAAYSQDFATPAGQSRDQWAEERRARIVSKSKISVKIDALEISVDGSKAVAHFRQDYRADKLTANSRKTLTFVKVNGKWLIQQEKTGS